MPGTYCNGKPEEQPFVKESQAFCEGMLYRAGGTGAERPVTDDPFGNDSPTESAAWVRGWGVADAAAGGTISATDAGCCAARDLAVSA